MVAARRTPSKPSGEISVRKSGPRRSSQVKEEQGHQGYQIVVDDAWLERGQTFAQVNRQMSKSFSSTNYLAHIPCVFTHDLTTKHVKGRRGYTLDQPSATAERTCNSFLQYRILAQRSFKGQQTDISKEVDKLWRNESKEMLFFCHRNSEIETRMQLAN